MANISLLLSLINGTAQTVDLSANTLVTSIVKVGGGAGTDLTKSILDRLIPLQNGTDVDATYHIHDTHNDTRYYTQSQIGQVTGVTGSDLVGDDDTYSEFTPAAATVKGAFSGIDSALSTINTAIGTFANKNLSNLISTAINADLNPDFFTNANNRKIGDTLPFSVIRAAKFTAEPVIYTLTGDFDSTLNTITNIVGTLPAYTGPNTVYTVYAPGYTGFQDEPQDSEVGIDSFDSPTQITMSTTAQKTGTGVTFFLAAVSLFGSENQTDKTGAVLVGSGAAVSGSSGLTLIKSGDVVATPSFVTSQGISYTSGVSGWLANTYSVQTVIDATLTVLSSGTLVVNNVYVINNYVAGDNFTNVGGTNVTGAVFRATGTTPTTWTNGSTLQPLVIQGTATRLVCRIASTTVRDELLAAINATINFTHDYIAISAGGANVTQVAATVRLSGAIFNGDVILGDYDSGRVTIGTPYLILNNPDINNQVFVRGSATYGSQASANMFFISGTPFGNANSGGMSFRSADMDGSGGSGGTTIRTGSIRGAIASGNTTVTTGATNALATANSGNSVFSTGNINGLSGNSGSVTVTSGNIVAGAAGSATGGLNLNSGNINISNSTASTGNVSLISGSNVSTVAGATGQAVVRSGDLTAAGSGNTGQGVFKSGDKTNAAATGVTGNVTLRSGSHSGLPTVTNSTGTTTVQSGDITNTSAVASAASGNVNVFSGANAGSGPTGNLLVISSGKPNVPGVLGNSGSATYGSGQAVAGNSGAVSVASGPITNSGVGNSGALSLASGAALTGNSGIASLSSGSSVSGTTGQVNSISGAVTGAGSTTNTGDVATRSGHITGASASGATGQAVFRSGDVQAASVSGSAGTGAAIFRSGDILGTTSGNTGDVTSRSGHNAGTGTTGSYTAKSGDITSATSSNNTGFMHVNSGDVTNASGSATSGEAVFRSGDVAGSGFSAQALIRSGNTNTGNSGPVNIYSGNVGAGSGLSGDINIQTGTAANANNRGSVNVIGNYVWLRTDVGTANNIHFVPGGNAIAYFDSGSNLRSAIHTTDENPFGVTTNSSFSGSSQTIYNSVGVYAGSDAGGATKGGDVVIGGGYGGVSTQNGGDVWIQSGDSALGNGGNVVLNANGIGLNRGHVVVGGQTLQVTADDVYFTVNDTVTIGSGKRLALLNTANSFGTFLQAQPGATSSLNLYLPQADGADGDVVKTNGAGVLRIERGNYVSSIKTTTYLAVNYDEIFADSSGGAFTITLPASPVLGQRVKIADYAANWATNNVTVARNGSNIQGAAADFTLNVNGAKVEFIYVDSTRGWNVY